jgi:hypothetical protein
MGDLVKVWRQERTIAVGRELPLAQELLELLIALCAHSHSASQFLLHLPQH